MRARIKYMEQFIEEYSKESEDPNYSKLTKKIEKYEDKL